MGAGESKSQEYMECLPLFSKDEQGNILKLFHEICLENEISFSQLEFNKFTDSLLSEKLSSNFFKHMVSAIAEEEPAKSRKSKKKTKEVEHEHFFVSLARVLKGSLQQKAILLCCLATGELRGPATLQQLRELIRALLDAYEKALRGPEVYAQVYNTWNVTISDDGAERYTRFLTHELLYTHGEQHCDVVDDELPLNKTFELDEIEIWLSRCPQLLGITNFVFYSLFPLDYIEEHQAWQRKLIPLCKGILPPHRSTILLDLTTLIFLNNSLPLELQSEWRLLFSSVNHGESFITLVRQITHQGPSIIVIRDADGHVFGGFASESWSLRPQFVGSGQCFLFTLSPHIGLYTSSGYNENYMYLNVGQETMPNGLGMGGQPDYHGLWLDYEYGKGHSRAQPKCTTFNSPQLSAKPDFQPVAIEVWGVGPEKKLTLEEQEAENKGSILDKDPQAKAMLNLLGKGPVSEGLREGDPMADTPEEHSLQH